MCFKAASWIDSSPPSRDLESSRASQHRLKCVKSKVLVKISFQIQMEMHAFGLEVLQLYI